MRYVVIILASLGLLYAVTIMPDAPSMFFDFAKGRSGDSWRAVNDGVMGGVSEGRLLFTDSTAQFSGHLSLDNNGGFASLRSPKTDYDFSDIEGFILRIKTDGRTYTFSLNDTYYFNGVYYEKKFTTPADTWAEIRLPLSAFEGCYLGEPSPQVAPFDPSQVKGLGIVLKDKKEGPFSIEIDWLKVY